jgi:2-methylcitrate dehydratase PrpD
MLAIARRMSVVAAAGLTLALAEKSSALSYQELPDDVIEIARQALLDWFGVTLGGSGEDGPMMLLETLPPGDPSDARTVSVVGHTVRLPALHAALVNGTASHRLDFDDVNLNFLGHASVAVIGATLALAEQEDAGGQELITAFVSGYETACRLALAIGPQPYLRGFHSTGTVGTFGAAAACARLLDLSPARTALAFGIAASQAAGLKSNLGTMTKSLHAGKACENGLLATLLAARGFTANTQSIEADQGFAALAGGTCDMTAALADPPAGWHLRENLFKYHAACFFTHSTIDGIRYLRSAVGVDADEVERVTVHVGEVELGACAIAEPTTGLEVKFSLVHLAAMALLDRDTTVITDEDAEDPQVIAMRRKVVLVDDGQPGQPTHLDIKLRDGTTVHAAQDVNSPERDLAVQRERLSRKFLSLAEPVLGSAAAAELMAELHSLDRTLSVRQLMSLARSA